jgi:hypothetical protein
MKNQPIESVALKQESQPRNAKKLWRPIAAAALTLTTALGINHLYNPEEGQERVEVNPSPQTSDRQFYVDRQELKEMQKAKMKAHIAEQKYRARLERFYSVIVWNNTVWYNELTKPKIPYDAALWERLHVCEQSGNWYANGYNSRDPYHQLFQGGLGMSTEAWDLGVEAAKRRGVTLPDSALDATIDQQMQGAQAFYEDEGWGWECDVRLPGQ